MGGSGGRDSLRARLVAAAKLSYYSAFALAYALAGSSADLVKTRL